MNMLDAQTAATPLLAAAAGVHAWIEDGGGRAPMRAALVRFWMAPDCCRRRCR